VDEDGKLHRHRPLARDAYLGKITPMLSYTHGGAAFILLILPAWEEGANQGADEAKTAE
jgi:hypothetical protein